MLRNLFRRTPAPRLGRWSTQSSDDVVALRARLANHDACGAHACETPVHLGADDADDEWYAQYLVSPSSAPDRSLAEASLTARER